LPNRRRSLVALVILDGWGCAPPGPGNAVEAARTPVFDRLWRTYPHTTLAASGEAVGLPPGQMGNSEVGHLTIGSGRVLDQDLQRVNRAIRDGSLFENEALRGAFERGERVHLLGLVSYGGVHSHIDHLRALLRFAPEKTWIHAFTDGRDVSPHSAVHDLAELPTDRIATVSGRYYAMDRDQRWDRTQLAYDAVVSGRGEQAGDPIEAVRRSYERGVTDEFIVPTVISGRPRLQPGADTAVFFNFRPDRARQLSMKLLEASADLTTMTRYRDDFDCPVVFGEQEVHATLAELLAARGVFTAAADNLGRWFSRGFELYRSYEWEKPTGQPWRKAEAVNAQALPALDACAASGQPFFLFVHYWDPHTPYLPPPPFDRMFHRGDERDPANRSMEPVLAFEPFRAYFEQWLDGVTDVGFPIAQYDAEIAYADAAIAHLLTRLDELGLREQTLVIVVADHGEIMDEHVGCFDHHGLYEGNVRIPCLLSWPGRVPSGQRLGGTVRMLDLAPTVLDAFGLVDLGWEHGLPGQSLLGLAEHGDERGTCREVLLTECTWQRKRAWRTPEWKLIEALEPDPHGGPTVELYDRADPLERENLAAARPDVVADLTARMHGYVRRRAAESGRPDPLETGRITLRRIGPPRPTAPEEKQYAEGGRDVATP
jgi:bisphosphoglycerate-independent phosphoglycerate mutase (AlkP superfamily)